MHALREVYDGKKIVKRVGWTVLAITIGCLPGIRSLRKAAHDTAAAHRTLGAATAPPVTAFVDVAVVPMDRERVLTHQTVLVQSGRITALGATTHVKVPVGAVRIDGRGKYLIPGLADMHAHIPTIGATPAFMEGGEEATAQAERMLLLMLANGVTTVRLAYAWPQTLRLKARAAAGELLSPGIYAATVDRDTASFSVAKASGFDLVKIPRPYNTVSPPFDSLVTTARRTGLLVFGHIPPMQAIQAGVASIEHLFGYSELLAGVQDWGRGPKTWDRMAQHPIDETKLRTLAVSMQQHGIWNCPTQMLYEINLWSADSLEHWPEMVYISETSRREWRKMLSFSASSTELSLAQPAMIARRKVIRALRDAEAGLLLGTDTPVPYMVPGFAVHRELEAFVNAGLTPYEALATGTRNVAAFFGTLDSAGTIAAGKRADMVLLTGNPLQDIRHTSQSAGVMIGGRWLGRAELDDRLNALKGRVF